MQLVLWCVAMYTVRISCNEIENKVLEYFNSDTVRSFYADWQIHQAAMENAIQLGITETYGHPGMNIFMRRNTDPLINEGYLHYDNQVYLLLLAIHLEGLPSLRLPEVSYVLPNNVMQIESLISRMIVRATYNCFRNYSDIIYAMKDQDPDKSSPYRFQQVQTMGEVAIVIEGCMLTGSIMTILNGDSVIIGHDTLRISKCQYTMEINSALGSPPVIAKYNMEGEGLSIEHFLVRPIRGELLPKLQAILYNLINTTTIFGNKLPKYMALQENILNETTRFSNDFVQQYNKLTMELNQGIREMPDFKITWNDDSADRGNNSVIELTKIIVTGLDTLYSAHNGGPYRNPDVKIGDEVRFNILQVSGEIYFKNPIFDTTTEFSVIIHDTEVDMTYAVNPSASKSSRFIIDTWRDIEFVIPNSEYIMAESVLAGYVQNKLPRILIRHLTNIYEQISKPSKEGGKKKNKKKCNSDDESSEGKQITLLSNDDAGGRHPNVAIEYFAPNTDTDRGIHVDIFTEYSDDDGNESDDEDSNKYKPHPLPDPTDVDEKKRNRNVKNVRWSKRHT